MKIDDQRRDYATMLLSSKAGAKGEKYVVVNFWHDPPRWRRFHDEANLREYCADKFIREDDDRWHVYESGGRPKWVKAVDASKFFFNRVNWAADTLRRNNANYLVVRKQEVFHLRAFKRLNDAVKYLRNKSTNDYEVYANTQRDLDEIHAAWKVVAEIHEARQRVFHRGKFLC